ncbi:MAG: hypothetical protein KA004_18055 [Verrucomicrobiales bacterium]|nr:hypothetical protein [Verrucomicrobiales bacterium]
MAAYTRLPSGICSAQSLKPLTHTAPPRDGQKPWAVPGDNGSWNMDAYDRLTREFLVISRPQRSDLGLQVIPVHRLVSVQFGEGGFKKGDGNQPKSGM